MRHIMEQYDYTSELINKWTALGHLTNVRDVDRTRVAQRLEAAHRRSLGQRGDSRALEREIQLLKREGFFGRSHR